MESTVTPPPPPTDSQCLVGFLVGYILLGAMFLMGACIIFNVIVCHVYYKYSGDPPPRWLLKLFSPTFKRRTKSKRGTEERACSHLVRTCIFGSYINLSIYMLRYFCIFSLLEFTRIDFLVSIQYNIEQYRCINYI